MRLVHAVPLTLVLALGAAPSLRAQIANPGFETGSLSPWFNDRHFCDSNSCTDWFVTAQDSHTGRYSAETDNNIEIRQNFAAVPTSSISFFSFWLRHPTNNGLPAFISFFYDDATSSGMIVTTSSTDWEMFDVTSLLAPGKNVDGFSVFGVTNGNITRLDDVNVKAVVATPEPASMALLATGLVGVFGAARRRRKSTAVA